MNTQQQAEAIARECAEAPAKEIADAIGFMQKQFGFKDQPKMLAELKEVFAKKIARANTTAANRIAALKVKESGAVGRMESLLESVDTPFASDREALTALRAIINEGTE